MSVSVACTDTGVAGDAQECGAMQGEAEREVVRVTVECCLQERSWNPYYMHLLQRLLAASKAHRVTLQYCLWDQFKQAEQTDMRRLINLAHLTAQLIATFTISLSVLKVMYYWQANGLDVSCFASCSCLFVGHVSTWVTWHAAGLLVLLLKTARWCSLLPPVLCIVVLRLVRGMELDA